MSWTSQSLRTCPFTIKDTTSLLHRFYSSRGYLDGMRTYESQVRGIPCPMNLDLIEKETLRQRVNSFSLQSRNSSIHRCEPCYRQLYPSKKRKTTYTIPKKPPNTPTVVQRKSSSFKTNYESHNDQRLKARKFQWPPLYTYKKKYVPNSEERTNALPHWLLPLYSCKNSNMPSSSEARFSGSTFRRKMELMESIKQLQATQAARKITQQPENEDKKEGQINSVKNPDSVEALKRKIASMQNYLSAMQKMEHYRKTDQQLVKMQGTLPNEQLPPLEYPYSRIYKTKPPNITQEMKVRRSMIPGLTSSTPAEKNITTGLNDKHQLEGTIANNILADPSRQINKTTPEGTASSSSFGPIHKESVMTIKQPSWKKDQATTTGINEVGINKQPKGSKPPEKDADAWTVDSLKSRINVMKLHKNEEGTIRNPEGLNLTKNGGEVKPKISQVALRSFHKETGVKILKTSQPKAMHVRLGVQGTLCRRNFSSFSKYRNSSADVVLTFLNRRTSFSTPLGSGQKRNWLRRLKRYFVVKKIKGLKTENWKQAPRDVPYQNKSVTCYSPAPMLWKAPEMSNNVREANSTAVTFQEKVNPAVLNAEQRVLASLSRMTSNEPQAEDAPGRVTDIEKKIKRAKSKINLTPWFREPKPTAQTLPHIRDSDELKPLEQENDETQENGYKWILNNKDLVENLKRQSQRSAGKSLVPSVVKASIDQYKLPLKAEISQYRKKLEQKDPQNLYITTSRRWYSTSSTGQHPIGVLTQDFMMVNTRGIKTYEHPTQFTPINKPLARKARSDTTLGTDSRQFNQKVNYGSTMEEKMSENTNGKETHQTTKKWTWKVPNKTRAFNGGHSVPNPPSRIVGTKMSEMSPCALKKQVEELKRLIKKVREEGPNKINDFPAEAPLQDDYEARLKRLIKAARNSAKKIQFADPKRTSENNMMPRNIGTEKRARGQATTQSSAKSGNAKPKPEASGLSSLFKNTSENPKTLVSSQKDCVKEAGKKSEKGISKLYLKFKTLVDTIRKKSVLPEPASNVELKPTKYVKGSISADALLAPSRRTMKSVHYVDVEVPPQNDKGESQVTVELQAKKAPSPANQIQLWKEEPKCKNPNYHASQNEPSYGEVVNLFSKARGIFSYQFPVLEDASNKKRSANTQVNANSTKNTRKTLTREELTRNWLSIREDVTHAARSLSECQNFGPGELETGNQSPQIKSPFEKHSVSEAHLVAKSTSPNKTMSLDQLITNSGKILGDCVWASLPVKMQDDEDILGKSAADKHTCSTGTDFKVGIIQEPTAFIKNTNNYNQAIQFEKSPSNNTSVINSKQGSSTNVANLEPTNNLSCQNHPAAPESTKNADNHGNSSLPGNPAESTLAEDDLQRNYTPRENGVTKEINITTAKFECEKTQYLESNSLASFPPNDRYISVSSRSAPEDGKTQQEHQETNEYAKKMEQSTLEYLKPLENSVRKYENHYKYYFSHDIINGENHLQQVYDELINLNAQNQATGHKTTKGDECQKQLIDEHSSTPSLKTSTKKKQAEGDRPETMVEFQPKVDTSVTIPANIVNADSCLKDQLEPTKKSTENLESKNNAEGVISHVRRTEQQTDMRVWNRVKNENASEQQTDMRVLSRVKNENASDSGSSSQELSTKETYIDASGDIQEGKDSQGNFDSVISRMIESKKKTQRDLCNANADRKNQLDNLLAQDPTLNPKVVKNLKMPVMLSEECHAEKNWYTRYNIGSSQNK